MSVKCFLGENQLAIHHHFKDSTAACDELNLCIGKYFFDLGRRTGGPGFVVSNRAVFNRDPHSSSTDSMFLK